MTHQLSVLVLLVGMGATAASPKRRPPRQPLRVGAVTFVTAQRAFIGDGANAGLKVGQTLELLRNGRQVATCQIDSLAARQASCKGTGARVGDTFHLPTRALEAARRVDARPRLPAGDELARWNRALHQATLPKVEFRGARIAPARVAAQLATASLEHASWAFLSGPGRDSHQETLDLGLYGLELSSGFRFFLRASAVGWAGRAIAFRSPLRQGAQLYVREANLTSREPRQSHRIAIGRIWPWGIPGLASLDGVQGGWSLSPQLEVGVFAGALPDPVSLAPTTRQWTAGLYQSWERVGGADDGHRLFRQQARLAAVSLAIEGVRLEAESAVEVRARPGLELSSGVKLGLGQRTAPGYVDAARVSLGLRSKDRALHVTATGRYIGLALAEPLAMLGSSDARSLRADLVMGLDPVSGVSLILISGLVQDLESRLMRGFLGSEAGLSPSSSAGVAWAVGYQEELGWWGRRSAYVQCTARIAKRARILGRGTFTQDTPAFGTGDFSSREVGVFANAELALSPRLSLHLSVLARRGLGLWVAGGQAAPRGVSSTGLLATAGVAGSL